MDITSINAYNSSLFEATKAHTEQSKASSFEDYLNQTVENKDDEELKKACKEFESYFTGYIFKQAQKAVYSINQENSIVTRSQGEEMFTEMLIDEYSEISAEQGGLGLADTLYKQLSKQ